MDILDGLDMEAHALVDVRIEATQRVAMCATQVLDDLPTRSIRSYSLQAIRSRRSSSSHHPIDEIQNRSSIAAHAAMLPANQSGSPNLTVSGQILEVGGLADGAAEVRPGHERRRSLTGDDDVPSDVPSDMPSEAVAHEDQDPMDREAAETSGDAQGDGHMGGGTRDAEELPRDEGLPGDDSVGGDEAVGVTAVGLPSIDDAASEGHGAAQSGGGQEVPTDGSLCLHQAAEPDQACAETAARADPADCAETAACAPCQEDECELQVHLTLASLQHQQQPVEAQLEGGSRGPDGPIDSHDSHHGSLDSMQEEGMQVDGDSAAHLAVEGRTGTLITEAAATPDFPADIANKGMAAVGLLIGTPLSRAATVADPPSGPDPAPEAVPLTDPEADLSTVSIRENPVPVAPAINTAPAPGDVSIAPSPDLAPASPPAPEGDVGAPSLAPALEARPNQHPDLTDDPVTDDSPVPIGDDVRTTEEDEAGGLMTTAAPISGVVHSGPSASSSLVGSESQRLGTLPDTYCGDLPELRREANRIHKGGFVLTGYFLVIF